MNQSIKIKFYLFRSSCECAGTSWRQWLCVLCVLKLICLRSSDGSVWWLCQVTCWVIRILMITCYRFQTCRILGRAWPLTEVFNQILWGCGSHNGTRLGDIVIAHCIDLQVLASRDFLHFIWFLIHWNRAATAAMHDWQRQLLESNCSFTSKATWRRSTIPEMGTSINIPVSQTSSEWNASTSMVWWSWFFPVCMSYFCSRVCFILGPVH